MKWRTRLAFLCAALSGMYAVLAQAQPAANSNARAAAVVNGVTISVADLEAALKMTGPVPASLSEGERRQRSMEALGMLIDNVLMQQFLEKNTPPVSPAEVHKRLADLEQGLKGDGKTLAEFCHDTHRTLDQVKAGIAEYLRWSAFAAQKITESTLKKYYEDNKDVFDKVTVRASHIVLRAPGNASEAEKAKVRARLQEIRDKLLKDPRADFAELAKQHSQDPSAAKGGDLGWFMRKWVFDEVFSRAAFALQPGQISDIVQTDYGFHLIKVTDRKPGEKSDFNMIKEAVRELCLVEMQQQILAEQRKIARITIGDK